MLGRSRSPGSAVKRPDMGRKRAHAASLHRPTLSPACACEAPAECESRSLIATAANDQSAPANHPAILDRLECLANPCGDDRAPFGSPLLAIETISREMCRPVSLGFVKYQRHLQANRRGAHSNFRRVGKAGRKRPPPPRVRYRTEITPGTARTICTAGGRPRCGRGRNETAAGSGPMRRPQPRRSSSA